jgi:serine/threonine protein kinase
MSLLEQNIHLIRDGSSGQGYALKVYTSHPEKGITSLNEIDILCRLKHPNLLQARDIIPGERSVALILPLGKWTLHSAIGGSILEPQCYVDIMWKLGSAIFFLHQHNFLLLNLTPDHIILRGNFTPLLADFTDAQSGEEVILDRSYISLNYRPPEHFIDTKSYLYSSKTNIWSLGIIYFELLTQSRAFPGESPEEIRSNLRPLLEPETRLLFIRSRLREPFLDAVDLLFRMLDPNPETRLDSNDLLSSSFFVTRIDNIHPIASSKKTRKSSLDSLEDYREIQVGLQEHLSLIAWYDTLDLCSRLDIGEADFWVILFIYHKLRDNPRRYNLEYFLERSQLTREEFLEVERNILLYLRGCF